MRLKRIFSLQLVLIILSLSSCSVYKSIDVGDITDVKFRGMTDNKILLDLKIPITNPNNFNLKIKSLDLDISVNGNDSLIIIPKKFNGVKNFPVVIEVDNILSSAMSFYKLKNARQVDIGLDGKIIAKSFLHKKTVKVSEKQTIDLKEKMGKINL